MCDSTNFKEIKFKISSNLKKTFSKISHNKKVINQNSEKFSNKIIYKTKRILPVPVDLKSQRENSFDNDSYNQIDLRQFILGHSKNLIAKNSVIGNKKILNNKLSKISIL
jgi:hypothetical protein